MYAILVLEALTGRGRRARWRFEKAFEESLNTHHGFNVSICPAKLAYEAPADTKASFNFLCKKVYSSDYTIPDASKNADNLDTEISGAECIPFTARGPFLSSHPQLPEDLSSSTPDIDREDRTKVCCRSRRRQVRQVRRLCYHCTSSLHDSRQLMARCAQVHVDRSY